MGVYWKPSDESSGISPQLEFCHKDGGRDIREERGDLEEVGGVGFRAKGITGRFSQEGSRG